MKRTGFLFKSLITLIPAVCLTVFTVSGCTSENDTGNTSEVSGSWNNDVLTQKIRSNDESKDVLDAEVILQSDNINIPIADLKGGLSEKEFREKFFSLMWMYVNEIQDSKLYGEDGCYLSACGAPVFSVEENRTTDEIQFFIFTKDLEEAGTVYFHNQGKEISVSVETTLTDTRSVVLKKLSENKDKRYVMLINGLQSMLLGSENNIVHISAVNASSDLEIIGDCYSLLENNGLSISYSDITDSENLIWFDFSETAAAAATEVTTTTAAKADTEVPTETAAEVQNKTVNDLTPEELEVYNSMPDIVLVLSHTYDTYPNIRGFYITKNGEIKMYAFSDKKEGVYTAVPEIYDELENVTCSEFLFGAGNEITQDDLDTVAISDLIELYNKLLRVDEKSEFEEKNNYCDEVCGIYELYGIRTNKNGGKEIILLSLSGDYFLISEDIYAREISDEIWNIDCPFSEYRTR